MKSESNTSVKSEESQVREEVVDTSRRSFARGGVVAPVLMTLAAKPAFAIQCMSEQMSGTHSNGTESCGLGDSPGGWANPGGQIGGQSTIDAWSSLGLDFGTYDSTNKIGRHQTCGSTNQQNAKCYDGGSTFNDLFNGQAEFCSLTRGAQVSGTLRDILLPAGTVEAHLGAAMLNALYFPNYALKPCDVIGLWNGSVTPPHNLSITDFLDSTW